MSLTLTSLVTTLTYLRNYINLITVRNYTNLITVNVKYDLGRVEIRGVTKMGLPEVLNSIGNIIQTNFCEAPHRVMLQHKRNTFRLVDLPVTRLFAQVELAHY